MNWDTLDALAAKLMKNRAPHRERERGFVYYHGKRVGNSAIELRKLVLPDDPSGDDAVRLAGMFHDVGKGISPHERFGAAIFREAVKDILEPEFVERVAAMIAVHPDRRPEQVDYDAWTRLLQDADMLDHSGCYGIWMGAQFYSVNEGDMEDSVRYHEENNEKYYSENVSKLNFDISREIFRDKIDAENAFFKRAA